MVIYVNVHDDIEAKYKEIVRMSGYYLLFNQKVKSDIPLPEAVPIDPTEEIDITVEYGLPPQWVLGKIQEGQIDHIEEQVMWFNLEKLVLFYIEKGNHIIIYRQSDLITELAIRSYLTGSAMALALMQKGYLPIHGGTVEYQGKGIIISGESGAGKSTITMELYEQGFQFVADDVSVVDLQEREAMVFPGFPQQKFCRDVVEEKSFNMEELIYVDEDRDKFARILKSGYVIHPLPIACMIELRVSDQIDQPECVEVQGGNKLYQIMHNVYRGLVFDRLDNKPERLRMFVQAASRIPMYRITRPKVGNSVTSIIELIYKQVLEIPRNKDAFIAV